MQGFPVFPHLLHDQKLEDEKEQKLQMTKAKEFSVMNSSVLEGQSGSLTWGSVLHSRVDVYKLWASEKKQQHPEDSI